jgi:hypothetical protein
MLFVLGKPLQCSEPTRVNGSSALKRLANDKRSSLFYLLVTDKEKGLITLTPERDDERNCEKFPKSGKNFFLSRMRIFLIQT